jgi:uncharacterized membrane protein YfcA
VSAILGLILLVAFLFSMVGMGGGQVYTPACYWLGLDLRAQAVPLALWLSFTTQSTAAATYWKHGLVKFRAGLPIVAGLIVFAPVGAVFAHRVSDTLILFLFATMTVVAVAVTLTGWRPRRSALNPAELLLIGLLVGALVGFLAGMVGRGGGSLIVPVLLLLGFEPKNAAATSAFAAAFSSLTGFLGHLGAAGLPVPPLWFAAFTATAIMAAVAGSRMMARRLDSRKVRRLFTVVLLGIAVKLYWDIFAS